MVVTEWGVVRILLVKTSANSKAMTVEELEGRRKMLHLANLDHSRADCERAIAAHGSSVSAELTASILRQYDVLAGRHHAMEAGAYNTDEASRAVVTELLDAKAFAQDLLDLSVENSRHAFLNEAYVNQMPLRVAHRVMVERHHQRLDVGVSPQCDGMGRIVIEDGLSRLHARVVLREAALHLCRTRGVVGAGEGALEQRNEVGETPLLQAAADGQVLSVALLLRAGANLHAIDTAQGDMAHMWAANSGHADCLGVLLAAGARVEDRSGAGETALLYATMKGHTACLRALLAAGAEVGVCGIDGRTALMSAAQNGHAACLRALLAAGADVEACDNNGYTIIDCVQQHCLGTAEQKSACQGALAQQALLLAARLGMAYAVAGHAARGADINMTGADGLTALDVCRDAACTTLLRTLGAQHSLLHAADQGWPDVVATRMAAHADIHAKNAGGSTALELATAKEHVACMALLRGDTLSLMHAAQACLPDEVAARIAEGVTVDALDTARSMSSLMWAALKGFTSIIALLLEAGAKLDFADSEHGMTALLLACAGGHEDAATLLVPPTIAASALNVVADNGYSALMWAEEQALASVVQLLREGGAAVVRRPALVLFRGEQEKVLLNVMDHTATFKNSDLSYATLTSSHCCPAGAKGYFELKILQIEPFSRHHYGFASPALKRVLGFSDKRLGEDKESWSMNSINQSRWHDGAREDFACEVLKVGDVVGLACDLKNKDLLISVNGIFHKDALFHLDAVAVRDGLFAAFSAQTGTVRYNLGEAPFLYAAPSADYKGFVDFMHANGTAEQNG